MLIDFLYPLSKFVFLIYISFYSFCIFATNALNGDNYARLPSLFKEKLILLILNQWFFKLRSNQQWIGNYNLFIEFKIFLVFNGPSEMFKI